ncbi:hypothetical protein DPMN_163150 [Dreissena polymorpha]|uniref:Uncharacterized protein n=1 Tax=Dreissena polymorpha TaxID=45954 RepID=A0A9D4ERK1_DREPO|nr:hypothetical protein DPMN_163150 [Dreissena polymorpha]
MVTHSIASSAFFSVPCRLPRTCLQLCSVASTGRLKYHNAQLLTKIIKREVTISSSCPTRFLGARRFASRSLAWELVSVL